MRSGAWDALSPRFDEMSVSTALHLLGGTVNDHMTQTYGCALGAVLKAQVGVCCV